MLTSNSPARSDSQAAGDDEPQETEEQASNYFPTELFRHPVPDSSDGETYLLKLPKFLTLDPVAFNLEKFQPPEDPQARDGKPSAAFSAYESAISTIRWRHSPSNPNKIQSNARILRWSDGSLTLQLASDPINQYVVQAERLAPRQINPAKPTPVSVIDQTGRVGRPYIKRDDVSAYLYSPSRTSYMLRATNKLTASLSVLPNTKKNDEALARLQQSTAAANRSALAEGGTFKLEATLEDPDLARKRAEVAEREKQRAQRRAENAQTRQMLRNAQTLGRVGVGALGRSAAGLSAADLEDERAGGGFGRRAGAASRPRKRTARRGDRSESEEMDYEDEEDEGFIAKDDEEDEEDDEEEEEDELERQEARIERFEAEMRTPKKAAAKRETPEERVTPDPATQGSPVSRQKRRRVIDDDEEEE